MDYSHVPCELRLAVRLRSKPFPDDTGMFLTQLYNDYENHTLIYHACRT
jgi:hypothetical protein